MVDTAMIAPWVRRFLLEHVVGERNLSLNTQKSYRVLEHAAIAAASEGQHLIELDAFTKLSDIF